MAMEQNFSKFGWKEDPFTLKIDPSLFTGYGEQVNALENHVSEHHKIALVTGPTGSGKTTLLKWLETNMPGCAKLYVSKPPEKPEQFVGIFTDIFGISFFDRLIGRKVTLFNLPKYVNSKLRGHHLVFLLDEAHETNREVMEWLRVLIDQISSISLVMAGMPVLERKIKEELETLDQRITTRVALQALNRDDTRSLIRKRIEAAGGTGIAPFSDSAVDAIYSKTGGFPREVIKLCDKLVKDAIEKGFDVIEAANIDTYREFDQNVRVEEQTVTFTPKPPSEEQFNNLPYKQKKILEVLAKQDWLTPSAIVDAVEMKSYKSKGHAVRSVNNILHRLMFEGYIQRESRGKAFMYALSPKVKTLFVEK
ncbi:MAG: AAA family ATPase [Candidatus Aenigmatarchaeota archaeon]